MNILKTVVTLGAILFSALSMATEQEVEIIPFTGEEEYGKWVYDANAAGKYSRDGSMDEQMMVVRSDNAGSDDHALAKKRIDAAPFRDKRVRLKVDYKPTDVSGSVILFFSAEEQTESQTKVLAWDNTYVDPVRGTSGWKSKEMVLQVPEESTFLYLGAGLAGKGKVEIGAVELVEVPTSVAVTDKEYIGKLYDAGKYEEFLAEIDKIDAGQPHEARYVNLAMSRYNALRELGEDNAAGKQLKNIVKIISSEKWQENNRSAWSHALESEVMYLSGKLSDDAFIQAVAALDFQKEDARKAALKNAYHAIGFNHRLNGNVAAAKKAYEKAASREWGADHDYSSVDRRLEEMKKALVAMDN